jgi:hypothetical protein
MFHKVSYEWFRVTQYIPELGLFYKNVGILLGQSSVTATSAYLGVSENSALELARSINV